MKTILVKADTKLADIKEGDVVMTGELHEVVKIDGNHLHVVQVRPRCETCGSRKCSHRYIKRVGWGQQSVQKVLRVRK